MSDNLIIFILGYISIITNFISLEVQSNQKTLKKLPTAISFLISIIIVIVSLIKLIIE